MRSFKSNENIHKKEGGSYYVVSANKASSVTLQSPGNESQRKRTAIRPESVIIREDKIAMIAIKPSHRLVYIMLLGYMSSKSIISGKNSCAVHAL